MDKFDELFDNSRLPNILSMAKTLSKEECGHIYNYMNKYKPSVVLEFGTQFGCSTAVFLQISEWLNLDIDLHSWDIVDQIKPQCVDKLKFKFHKCDITGNEEEIITRYVPDMVFLDAHPYAITKGLMKSCLKHKIDFLCHDISLPIFERAKERSNGFTNTDPSTLAEWELYLLGELISPSLLEDDSFEDNNVSVNCYRDKFGLAIIEVKK